MSVWYNYGYPSRQYSPSAGPLSTKKEALIMTIEEIRDKKKEYGYSIEELARRSGVPIGTLQKILSGTTKSPRSDTLRKLEAALISPLSHPYTDVSGSTGSCFVAEPPGYYGSAALSSDEIDYSRSDYTLVDYLALPDDIRVELIDGKFYDMAAPHIGHQGLGGELFFSLTNYVRRKNGPCIPFISPIDVQLDEDDRTVVQPDVAIICDRSRFRNGRIFGAPDFVAEVLSPSTRKKDLSIKLYKYINAGVREYWIIDPQKGKIVVYDIEHDILPSIYSFSDSVPVLIWDGECEVDFADIWPRVKFLYD